MAPGFGPPPFPFLPSPFMPVASMPPPAFHMQPTHNMPGPAYAPLQPSMIHSPAQPMLPQQTVAKLTDAASEPVADTMHSPAQPVCPPQTPAAYPVLDSEPAARPPPRRMAPAIVTPRHLEGLQWLLKQRESDGGSAPVVKPRDFAVVTPMPSEAELARLHAIVDERKPVAARGHMRGLLLDSAQRWAADGCPGGHAWLLTEQIRDKTGSAANGDVPAPAISQDTLSSPATAPSPVSVRTFCSL